MTNELTLRERVLDRVLGRRIEDQEDIDDAMITLITILEDTGAPAHMRVAAELRGE